MAPTPLRLNLGAGTTKLSGFLSVDAYGDQDVLWDLNQTPWPWEDNSCDRLYAAHIFEHLDDWWPAFLECTRILEPGGLLELHVPDESSSTALGWRDHKHVFHRNSFHGVKGYGHGTSTWAIAEKDSVPMELVQYHRVPYTQWEWMIRFPKLMRFCADHLRNFIHEQRFTFRKLSSVGEAQ